MTGRYSLEEHKGMTVLVVRIPLDIHPASLRITVPQKGLLPIERLSEPELAVYERILQRKQNKEIADDLALSISTVKFHVTSIFTKLGVNSRADIWWRAGFAEEV